MAGKYKTKQQSAILDCLKLQEKEYVTVTDIEKYLKENFRKNIYKNAVCYYIV